MKNSLCLLTTLLVSSASLPLQASTLADAVAECRQQQNALKRLVCYDDIKLTATPATVSSAASDAVQAHSQAPARPAPVSNNPATAKAAPTTNDFGLEHKKPAEKNADEMYMTVTKISYSPRKELIVEFDNGQVWRQNDSSYYDINVGEQHFIKRGMLNSFTLGNDANNRTIKVRRVE
jgi:hypothetical protein